MQFILRYLKGLAIGAGAILPGISSGVLCVVFGIYETLLNSILNFFQDWKKNLAFLFPILFGGITGIILFSNFITFFFQEYPTQTSFCFIGLILGSIPILLKTANREKGFHLHYLLYFFFTFSLALFLLVLENYFPQETNYCLPSFSFGFLVVSGFFMSIGVIVPRSK